MINFSDESMSRTFETFALLAAGIAGIRGDTRAGRAYRAKRATRPIYRAHEIISNRYNHYARAGARFYCKAFISAIQRQSADTRIHTTHGTPPTGATILTRAAHFGQLHGPRRGPFKRASL